MELNELFNVLREHGITEVTFKLSPKVEAKANVMVDYINNTDMAKEPKVKRQYKHRKPRSLTPEMIKKIREKKCPGFFTVKEIAEACDVAENAIYRFIVDTTPVYQDKASNTKFYQLEDIYYRRAAYETDILKHDGHRRGPVKFIADRMIELTK